MRDRHLILEQSLVSENDRQLILEQSVVSVTSVVRYVSSLRDRQPYHKVCVLCERQTSLQ